MKSTSLKYSILLLAVVFGGALLWNAFLSVPPTVTFVEMRESGYGYPVAVFRATNTSNEVYSYLGYGTASPFYDLREPAAAGWELEQLGFCGNGADFHEIPPHSSVDFVIGTSRASNFSLGVRFRRATRHELYRRRANPLWSFFETVRPTPAPSWSPLVP